MIRTQPTPDDAKQSWPVAVRSVLDLPRRLRGAHLPPVPARADVPPLSRTSSASARTAWCAPPISPTRYEARARRSAQSRSIPFLLRPLTRGYRRQRRRLPQQCAAAGGVRIHPADRRATRSATSTPRASRTCPYGLDDGAYQWIDLDGEGHARHPHRTGEALVLQAQPEPGHGNTDGWHRSSRRALRRHRTGCGNRHRWRRSAGSSSSTWPATASSTWSSLDGPTPGFTNARRRRAGSRSRRSRRCPTVDWSDPNLRFVDLTGDGHADVLITEDDAFRWHASLAEAGFGPARARAQGARRRRRAAPGLRRRHAVDLPRRPVRRRADRPRAGPQRRSLLLAEPRLRPLRRQGRRWTTRRGSTHPTCSTQRRIRLADIDGSGTTDIIYLRRDGVRLYFNQSGNSWSAAASPDSVSRHRQSGVVQRGRSARQRHRVPGLVLAAARRCAPADALHRSDGRQKPHLLVKSRATIWAPRPGATTRRRRVLSRRTSSPAGLDHALAVSGARGRAGRDATTTSAATASSRATATTTATSTATSANSAASAGSSSGTPKSSPPCSRGRSRGDEHRRRVARAAGITRTWFHTGVYLGAITSPISLPACWTRRPGSTTASPASTTTKREQLLLDDTVLPAGLTLEEEREACRALKGSMLRQEVYALDGTRQGTRIPTPSPNRTSPSCACSRRPATGTRCSSPMPARPSAYHYERNPSRSAHRAPALTLEVDAFGNVLKSAAIGYGRRQPDGSLSAAKTETEQTQLLAHLQRKRVHQLHRSAPTRIARPSPCESRSYELTGFQARRTTQARFALDEVDSQRQLRMHRHRTTKPRADGSLQTPPDRARAHPVPSRRSVGRSAALCRSARSNRWRCQSRATQLAFTPGLLAQVYGGTASTDVDARRRRAATCTAKSDANWWVPSGRSFLSPNASDDPAAGTRASRAQHFFVPQRLRDPFGKVERTRRLRRTRPAADRTPRPAWTTPCSSSTTTACCSRALSPIPMATAARPRSTRWAWWSAPQSWANRDEGLGRFTEGFDADLDATTVANHLQTPLVDPHASCRAPPRAWSTTSSLTSARSADAQPQPAVAHALARETHVSISAPTSRRGCSTASRTPTASAARSRRRSRPSRASRESGGPIDPRWVGSGWTVFNNKGKPVRQFEPFFSCRRTRFEFDGSKASARSCSTTRSSASSPRCIPTIPGRRSSSIRGGRRPGMSTTPR